MDAQPEFLLEIEELVEEIFVDLDELRAASTAPRVSGRVARDLLDRVFRHVHSVKGSAASCGLEVVSRLAHELENLLAEIRAGRILVNDETLATCESATEVLSESLRLAAAGIVAPPPHALLERLQTAARKQTTSSASEAFQASRSQIPVDVWQGASAAEQQRLRALVAEGNCLFAVTASFGRANFVDRFLRLQEQLAEFGEVISTSPAVDEAHPDHVTFRILYGSAELRKLETATADFPGVAFKPLPNATRTDPEENSNTSAAFQATLATVANVVRVDVEQLDQLIFRAYQLLTLTLNTLEFALEEIPQASAAYRDLQKEKERIRASFLRLADDLVKLRMVSFGPMLRRAERTARRAARLAGKEIDCEIVGANFLLDKLVAEAIAGPLIQLVRNAVDHGIESVAERLKSGKKPRGTLRLEAISEGSQSRLRVVDDGRGIDPLLVSAAAQRLGIVPGDSPLDTDRSLRLIFRPRFTTLAAVSEVSGRGVGLDIVETAVEQVGGEVRVSSQPGIGTTFEIRLPVTFGLLDATVVVAGGERYCIPSNQIVAITSAETPTPDKLSVISMHDLLGQPQGTVADGSPANEHPNKQSSLVTCEYRIEPAGTSGNGRRRVALVVDAVAGKEEVLVRNLGRHAGRWSGVAGATELRDGTVALVLDLPRLLRH